MEPTLTYKIRHGLWKRVQRPKRDDDVQDYMRWIKRMDKIFLAEKGRKEFGEYANKNRDFNVWLLNRFDKERTLKV